MWLHGERVPTQRWITHVALTLSGREHPFRRISWRARKPMPSSTLRPSRPAPAKPAASPDAPTPAAAR